MAKELPFRVTPIVPSNVPTLYSNLASQLHRAFQQQRKRPSQAVEVQFKLGFVHVSRPEQKPFLQLLQRISQDNPLILKSKVLPYQFQSNLPQDLFLRVQEHFEELSARKTKSSEFDFYGEFGSSSVQTMSLKKTFQGVRLDIRIGNKRFQFDREGKTTVTVKKSLFDHTDMLLGRTGIRLSKNIEENLAFSQTEFDEHIKGKAFFRLKLVKRFVKCGWVEYGLSSILQRELLADDKADEFKEELLTNIREGTLKDYLPGLMAQLYDSQARFVKKFECEAEILPKGMADNQGSTYPLAKAMFEDMVSLSQAKLMYEKEWLRKLGLQKWKEDTHWRVIGNYIHQTLLPSPK